MALNGSLATKDAAGKLVTDLSLAIVGWNGGTPMSANGLAIGTSGIGPYYNAGLAYYGERLAVSAGPATNWVAGLPVDALGRVVVANAAVTNYAPNGVPLTAAGFVAVTTAASGDTEAPTTPTGLMATPVSSTQINLTWTPATDNVGVVGYVVERCTGPSCEDFAQIATAAANAYNDPTVVGSTAYRYRVAGYDAAANVSAYSNVASAVTPVAPALEQTGADVVVTSEILAQLIGKVSADVIAFAETTQMASVKALAEALVSSDALVWLLTRALTDAVTANDAVAFMLAKSYDEAVVTADANSMGVGRASSDFISTVDSVGFSGSGGTNLTDTTAASDALSWLMDTFRGDAPTITDIAELMAAKEFFENIGLADALTKLLTKALADAVASAETMDQLMDRITSDITTSTDSLARTLSKDLLDTFTSTDNASLVLSKNLDLTDAVASTDNASPALSGTSLTDVVVSTDSASPALSKTLADAVASADNVAPALSKDLALTDSVATADNATPTLGGGAASPADLFAAGELGFWLDPSDITTLFQNSAGTTPVTAAGQPVGYIADKSGRGNHFTQATAADRPIYQVDANGKGYLAFSAGIESLVKVNPTISGDKMSIWLGVYKQSDAAIGTILESSADPNANPLTISIVGPTGAPANSPDYGFRTRGNGAALCAGNGPDTFPNSRFDVLQCSLNNGGATDPLKVIGRINGVQQTLAFTGTGGTGNYASLPFWIGARNGASNPFIGRIYGVICRFTASTAQQISDNETWMAAKMGLPLAIASLFALNELGAWYDPSDKTTLFQDTAGTTPVTASGQTVARINDKSGRGLNLTQTTAASRPTYIEAAGLKSLLFDGVDDFMITASTNFSAGGGIINLWTGLYTDTNAGVGLVAELSATSSGNNGTWAIQSPPGDLDGFYWRSKGTVDVVLDVDGYPVLATHVLHGQGGISSDFSAIRVDGVQALQSLADQGTGNHGTYPVYVGRRGGTTFPFKGNIYGLVWRHAACTPQQVIDVEQVLAAKSGITF
jgi:hypothetical protein